MSSSPTSPSPSDPRGPRYWRSLGELASTPGFRRHLEREFPEGAAFLEGVDRRAFLKLMAASFALGGIGLSGCRRPETHILPFAKSIEGAAPGLPLYYATAMPLRRHAIPLLAETHQGRPTKLEGNPAVPGSTGATTLAAQASLLDLYDPDRATQHSRQGTPIDNAAVAALLADLAKTHAADAGTSLAILAGASSSPSRAALVKKLRAVFPKMIWAEYEPVADEPPLEAALACFGKPVRPHYRLERAKCILSLDADFLGAEAGALENTGGFASGRRIAAESPSTAMNRLYVAESAFSLTGGMADHRLRLPASHHLALAAALAEKIIGKALLPTTEQELKVRPEWIAACAEDLLAHGAASLVIVGAHQPAAVHALGHAINAALGNIGSTLEFLPADPVSAVPLQDLAGLIGGGAIKTLLILGGNPVYDAPVDLDFGALLKRVPQIIRFGSHRDETSAVADIHIAAAHYLESWGDARTHDGTIVPIQPMILPLFNGLTELEVLARLAGIAVPDPYSLVFDTVATRAGPEADPAKVFEKFLHAGFLEGSAHRPVPVSFDSARATAFLRTAAAADKPMALSSKNLEVRFVADSKIDDGRFANNGWLQELPDPITKIAWDNAILVSPRLASELGVEPAASKFQVTRKPLAEFDDGMENAHVFELFLGERKIVGPVHIQPGLPDYTVVVPLGYGRTKSGRVGTGTGFNAYPLRTAAAPSFAAGARLTPTGRRALLANTQEHWSMEGRDLVREASLDEFRKNPAFVRSMGLEAHSPPVYGSEGDKLSLRQKATDIPRGASLYKTPAFDGVHQWAMSIDLNVCTGCNACVVACQAENNIPIVGREQVLRGREMHWLRIDRYYSDGALAASAFGGDENRRLPEEPQVSLQPLACGHCELAPCETVCPVNATVHDNEGLNVMAYNRCIGTRYCANNCPYKVRRFNFFDYNERRLEKLYSGPLGPHGMPDLVKMAKNPEVSVRMRGVMEKCTFCVQRLQNGKSQWKAKTAREGRPGEVSVPDGFIKTACQQACPAGAIVFGDLNDEKSAVSRAKRLPHDYALLGSLNIRPRTTYLGKLRNPNPRMPDYRDRPFSRIEHDRRAGGGAAPAHGGLR